MHIGHWPTPVWIHARTKVVCLLSLCDALGAPSLHLVGHSLGAQVGNFFAAVHPRRVGKPVVVDAGGHVPPDTLQIIGASLQRLGQLYPSLESYLSERRQVPTHQWNAFWVASYRYDAEVRVDGTVSSRVSKSAIEEELAVNTAINADALLTRITALTLVSCAALRTLAAVRGFILAAD